MPNWLKTRAGRVGLALMLISGLAMVLWLRAQPRPGAYLNQYKSLAARMDPDADLPQSSIFVTIARIDGANVTLQAEELTAPLTLFFAEPKQELTTGEGYQLSPLPGGVLALHQGQQVIALAGPGDRAIQLVSRHLHDAAPQGSTP